MENRNSAKTGIPILFKNTIDIRSLLQSPGDVLIKLNENKGYTICILLSGGIIQSDVYKNKKWTLESLTDLISAREFSIQTTSGKTINIKLKLIYPNATNAEFPGLIFNEEGKIIPIETNICPALGLKILENFLLDGKLSFVNSRATAYSCSLDNLTLSKIENKFAQLGINIKRMHGVIQNNIKDTFKVDTIAIFPINPSLQHFRNSKQTALQTNQILVNMIWFKDMLGKLNLAKLKILINFIRETKKLREIEMNQSLGNLYPSSNTNIDLCNKFLGILEYIYNKTRDINKNCFMLAQATRTSLNGQPNTLVPQVSGLPVFELVRNILFFSSDGAMPEKELEAKFHSFLTK